MTDEEVRKQAEWNQQSQGVPQKTRDIPGYYPPTMRELGERIDRLEALLIKVLEKLEQSK